MQLRAYTHEEAMDTLSLLTQRTCTQFPEFAVRPDALTAERDENGNVSIIFACHDTANERTYVVRQFFGAPCSEPAARMHECAIEATKYAMCAANSVNN